MIISQIILERLTNPELRFVHGVKNYNIMDHQGENALNFMLFKIKKNIKKTEIFLKNTAIPTSWTDPSKVAEPSDVCDKPYDLPYGVAGVASLYMILKLVLPNFNVFLDLLFPLKIILLILKLSSYHLLLKIHYYYQKFLGLLNLQNFFPEMSVL